MKMPFRKIIYLFLILLFSGNILISQKIDAPINDKTVQLLDSLWENPTSFFNINDANWRMLCKNLGRLILTI